MSEVPCKWYYAANTDAVPRCPKWQMHVEDATAYFGTLTRLAKCLGCTDGYLISIRAETGLLTPEHSVGLWLFTRGAIPLRVMPETVDYHDKEGRHMVATWYPPNLRLTDDEEPRLKNPPKKQEPELGWPRQQDYRPGSRSGFVSAAQRRWWFATRPPREQS